MRNLLMLVLFGGFLPLVNAQVLPDGVFKTFEAGLKGDVVDVAWVVFAGSQCYDVEVQRSTDGVNFEAIHSIPGICGGDIRYEYQDADPVPYRTNYYRLRSGLGDFSGVATVEYAFLEAEEEVMIFPQPVGETAELQFQNTKLEAYQLVIYDLAGRPVMQRQMERTNRVVLSFEQIPAGTYVYVLSRVGGGRTIRGTLRAR